MLATGEPLRCGGLADGRGATGCVPTTRYITGRATMQRLSERRHGATRRRRWTAAVLTTIIVSSGAMGGVAHAARVADRPAAGPAAGQPGGDIPDSAVYLHYAGRRFSVEYVEGWLQTAMPHGIMFSDKDSSVTVEMRPHVAGPLSTYVQRIDLPRLARVAGFVRGGLSGDRIGGQTALHLIFRDRSAPDAVTGKTVTLQS